MFRLNHSTGVACAILFLILGYWSDSDARPVEKRTPLTVAATDSEQVIHRALIEASSTRAAVLLDRGANIEARNARGATPLITASAAGNLALVTLLLKQGAEIEAKDRDGNTALHEASFQSHIQCVEVLLAAGAQATIQNGLGFTPLHQAVRRFWETAGESRADRLARQSKVIGRLLQYGSDPDVHDAEGRTPVVLAVESNNARLRQAFSPPPAHAAPPPVTPTMSRPVEERITDSNQSIVVPPALITSNASASTSKSPGFSDSMDQSREMPSLPVPTNDSTRTGAQSAPPLPAPAPVQPPDRRPDTAAPPSPITGDSHVERSTPVVPTPAQTQPTPQSTAPIASPSMTTPEPATVAPLLALNSESQISTTEPGSTIIPSPKLPKETGLEQDQTPVAKPGSTDQAVNTETARPTATPPLAAPLKTPRETTQASPPQSPLPIDPADGSHDERARPQTPLARPAFRPSGQDQRSRPVPFPAHPAEESVSPVARPSVPIQPTLPSSHTENVRTEARQDPWLFHNVGFGLGLGWTHNLGARRVDSVTVVNRIVRIDDERNDLVRVMPEVHLWIDRWDEQRWSWGPFLTVAPGSQIIDAVGCGLMMGYRPHQSDRYSFNFGIGGTLDFDARVLGDGIVANEPLPPRETSARTKHTTAAGLLVLFSVGWDVAAPRQTPQADPK